MPVPFIGPSHSLRSRTADVQRTIGMYPVPIEPGNTRTPWIMKDVPGLTVFADLGAEVRGGEKTNGRTFVVAGSTLYELSADGSKTERGMLASSTGLVDFAFNTTQLVISDATMLYVLTLATNVLTPVPNFPGGGRIGYIDQYILFRYRDSQQFGWTALGDASSIDGLDFASAEGSPDDLVGLIADHREALLFGTNSVENWLNVGGETVFSRNNGAAIEDGCASEWTIQKMDGSVYWLAASERGQGAVNKLQGYQPQRISTQSIEEMLHGLDLSQASAYTYETDKSNFYCLNVPGLDTTLVFDAFSGQWHERAEWVDGTYAKHRGTCHLYAFGRHLLGAADGKVYALDPTVSNNAGAPLIRERIMPDSATANRERLPYGPFSIDCDRGTGGLVQMRYSNDGGANWSAWAARALGEQGVFSPQVKWSRTGAARDRVTHVRMTDDAPFNPVAGGYA